MTKRRQEKAELFSPSKVLTSPPQSLELIVKPEPMFIGPENIVGPDPINFDAICTVPNDVDDSDIPDQSSKTQLSNVASNLSAEQLCSMEMAFLRAEKISLQTRIKSLEKQVYIPDPIIHMLLFSVF